MEEIPLHVKIKVKFGIKEATGDFICMCYTSASGGSGYSYDVCYLNH